MNAFPRTDHPLTRFVGRVLKPSNTLMKYAQFGGLDLNLLRSIVWSSSLWIKFPGGLGSLVSASSLEMRSTPAPPRSCVEASVVLYDCTIRLTCSVIPVVIDHMVGGHLSCLREIEQLRSELCMCEDLCEKND